MQNEAEKSRLQMRALDVTFLRCEWIIRSASRLIHVFL